MPSYPIRALVLRSHKLGESDRILHLLAADGSQVRAVAKGVRKTASKFGGRLEPYSEVDLLLHTGRSLDIIVEERAVTAHGALRDDVDRSTAAGVVADVVDKMSVEVQGEPRLFGLASATLSAMEVVAPASLPTVVVAFLVKAVSMHGTRPQLNSCVGCAAEASECSSFSTNAGGILCPACSGEDPSAVRFSSASRAWLAMLLGAKMTEVEALDVPSEAVRECFALLHTFLRHHIPARLKALDFYGWWLQEGGA